MARTERFQNPGKSVEQINQRLDDSEDRIDMLRSRAGLLSGKDRAIMQIYLDNSGTFRQMSRIAGINEANVARKIHKLIKRLLDGQYITCLQNRHKFTGEELDIARDYFLEGLPMSQIADNRSTTYYAVRQAMKKALQLTRVTENGGRNKKCGMEK